MRKGKLLILFIFFLWILGYHSLAASAEIIVSQINGAITPATEEFLTRILKQGQEENVQAIVLLLDTPGGLEESMRNMVKTILSSPIPIVVYVFPQGARAASAGSFLLISAHHAFMSPNTTVGAAHPVTAEGQTVSEKIVNDAASFMRSLAETRKRNPEIAEKMVRESISLTEKEALHHGIVEGIAQSVEDVLQFVHLENSQIVKIDMNTKEKIMQYLLNPNFAYLFLTLGALGIVFELANPGAIVPGVFGSILLLLSFYAFSLLPVNLVGMVLIFLGILFFVLDFFVTPGIGILSVGGVIAFFLGSLTLFTPGKGITLSFSLILAIVSSLAFFLIVILFAVVRTVRQKVKIGMDSMVGKCGVAKEDLSPEGFAVIDGELWWVRGENPIRKNERIKVLRKEGQILIVRKEE